jgi:hypothetical protein
VPEENSLVLGLGGTRFELPALDLVYHQPEALLGYNVHVTFGDEFPIRFDRNDWKKQNLANRFELVSAGDGWREERTGLPAGHSIETRRHWFSTKVHQHTHGSVNVLNLVVGDEIIIESPAGAFAPFIVHHAETFLVPAAVGEYTISPHGPSAGRECATIKAFVRA